MYCALLSPAGECWEEKWGFVTDLSFELKHEVSDFIIEMM